MQADKAGPWPPIKDFPSDTPTSVGGFVHRDYLEELDNDEGWSFKRDTISNLSFNCAEILVREKLIQAGSPRPELSQRCVFRNQLVFAWGTGFLVHKDMIIATCGHCVFTNDISAKRAVLDTAAPASKPGPAGKPHPSDVAKPDARNQAMVGKDTAGIRDLNEWKFIFGLTQKYAEDNAPPIPRANVWGLERVMFGQNGSLATTVSALGAARLSDRADWALIRLKPLEESAILAPILPLYSSDVRTLKDGATRLKTIGHTWGTSLKICDTAAHGATVLRKGVLAGELDGQTPAYDFDYVLRENLLTATGNSGGPLILCEPSDTVLGISSSKETTGKPLEATLYNWDPSKPRDIEPYVAADDHLRFYNSTTKNDLWSSLITPNAEIIIIIKATDWRLEPGAQGKGTITVKLDFEGPAEDYEHAPDARNAVRESVTGSKNTSVWVCELTGEYLPCELTSITIAYTKPSKYSSPAPKSVPPSLPPVHYLAVDETPRFIMEYLHVFSRKAREKDRTKWTPLLRMAEPTVLPVAHCEVVTSVFDTGPFISQGWTDALRKGDVQGLDFVH